MATVGGVLRALAIILAFTHLICSNDAVPITRSRSLLHSNLPSENSKLAPRDEVWKDKLVEKRMDAEIDDYPGSGANNRHTPRADKFAKGCIDF